MALLDNGMQINTTIPGYVENHSLNITPISDLIGRQVTCVGLGNALTWPIGYVIIQIQVDRVQGYDEDQISLVIPNLSNFEAWLPVILSTSTIGHIVNVIKESEMDVLATRWSTPKWPIFWQYNEPLSQWKMTRLPPKSWTLLNMMKSSPPKSKMVDAFLSKIIHVRTKTAFIRARLNVITQALCAELLPQGLMIQNTYTKICNGSKSVTIVVRNVMAYPQTMKKKIPVARVAAANWVPEAQMCPGMIDVLDEVWDIQTLRMTMEQRQEKLF